MQFPGHAQLLFVITFETPYIRKKVAQIIKQKAGEYDQKRPLSQTSDRPTAPRGRDVDLKQPNGSKNAIKENQPAIFSSAI